MGAMRAAMSDWLVYELSIQTPVMTMTNSHAEENFTTIRNNPDDFIIVYESDYLFIWKRKVGDLIVYVRQPE